MFARHYADKKPNPLRAVAIENSPMILANRQVGGCVFDDIQKLRTMEAHTIRTKETPSEVGTMLADGHHDGYRAARDKFFNSSWNDVWEVMGQPRAWVDRQIAV